MTSSLINYKNLKIVSPTPTGDAGIALNTNFTYIADTLQSLASGGSVPTLDSVLNAGASSNHAVELTGTDPATLWLSGGGGLQIEYPAKLSFNEGGANLSDDGNGALVASGSSFSFQGSGGDTYSLSGYSLTFNGSAQIEFGSGCIIHDDDASGLVIGVNGLTAPYALHVSAGNNVATSNNTLDDGSGNMTVNGILTCNVLQGLGAINIGEDNVGLTCDDHDVIALSSGNVLYVGPYDGITTSGGNTLDDGNGNMTVAGNLNLNDSTISATNTVSYNSGGYIQDDGIGGLTFAAANGYCLTISGDRSVHTIGNTLDDGSGNMSVAGSLTVATGQFIYGHFSGNGAAITTLNASSISTGTVPIARLPVASTSTQGILQVTNGNGLTLTTGTLSFSSSSITTLGTVTAGTWSGSVIGPTYGGTGVNNGSKTITLGGNLTTAGAFTTTLTATANTSVTLPTTGTLATTANLVPPTFQIVAGNVVFTNVPSGATLNIYKFTRKRSTSTTHTNTHNGRTYPLHRGKRYYLFQTISSFPGTLHFTDLVSLKRGCLNLKHGRFRFSYTVAGVESPQTKTIEIIKATGGVPNRVRFL